MKGDYESLDYIKRRIAAGNDLSAKHGQILLCGMQTMSNMLAVVKDQNDIYVGERNRALAREKELRDKVRTIAEHILKTHTGDFVEVCYSNDRSVCVCDGCELARKYLG